MDKQAFLWKIMAGELPAPKAAETLGMVFKDIDAQHCPGYAEVTENHAF